MKGLIYQIFSVAIVACFVLLNFVSISEASPLEFDESKRIYEQLTKEFELDKAKLDRGEPVNKLELMFRGYALDAVDFTEQKFKKKMDFSGESIKDVEECLDVLNKTRGQYNPSNEQLLVTAKMYAGYIGEVIKLKWGGEWRDKSEYSIDNGPALSVKGQHLFLVSKVYRRITGGTEDNIWQFYQIVKKDLENK